jgi:hypothetical protein
VRRGAYRIEGGPQQTSIAVRRKITSIAILARLFLRGVAINMRLACHNRLRLYRKKFL